MSMEQLQSPQLQIQEGTSHYDNRIVSGGMEGEVRIWKIGRQTQVMESSLKEHRGRVYDIQDRKSVV